MPRVGHAPPEFSIVWCVCWHGLFAVVCMQVVELLSTVIEHLVRGEVIQIKHALQNKASVDEVFDVYLKKSYYKTASLMANSCKVGAVGWPLNGDARWPCVRGANVVLCG